MSTNKEMTITIISSIVAFLAHLSLIAIMLCSLDSTLFIFFIIICMIITALVAFFVPTYKSQKIKIVRTIAITLFIETLTVNFVYIVIINLLGSISSNSWLITLIVIILRGSLPEKIIPCTLGMAITALVAFFIPAYKSKKIRIIKIVSITLFIATSLICLIDIWRLHLLVSDFFNK